MITTTPPCGATILMGINKNGTARGAIIENLSDVRLPNFNILTMPTFVWKMRDIKISRRLVTNFQLLHFNCNIY